MSVVPVATALAVVRPAATVVAPVGDLTRREVEELTLDAREALARAQAAAAAVETASGEFVALIRRAWDGRAHKALGLPSWAAYCEVAFGPIGALRIPIVTRVQMVAELTAERADGRKRMSARACGDALRMADQTMRADLKRARALAEAPAAAATEQPVPASEDVVDGEVVEAPILTLPAQALADLADLGPRGITGPELTRRHRDWTTGAWCVLSRLHRQGHVARLSGAIDDGTRDGHAVYVLTTPEALAGRLTEPPGRSRQRRP